MAPRTLLPWTFALPLALATGCGSAVPVPTPPPAVVTVSLPVTLPVTDYEEFTGYTDAVEKVEVRPRVGGYLIKVNFQDGAEVNAGDLLFQIDPSTYQADLDRAKAQVKLYEAQVRYSEAEYRRNITLNRQGSVSPEELEKSLASRDSNMASLQSARADVELKALNLGFTRVTAPIGGRTSRTQITVGNLVTADPNPTLLTTIVSIAPIYAYFTVDSGTVLRIQRMIREGKFQSARMTPERIVGAALALSNLRGGNFMPLASQFGLPRVPVFLGLETEPGQFPHEGFIDFVNNVVTPSTGTLSVRGLFPNGDRALTPGLFVRVRIPLGAPHPVLLVSDLALGMDQGQRFVYVVNAKNEVVFRPVTAGRLQGRLRVIEAGIGPNDRIIVNGLVRVRPGITVEPRMTPMPFAPEAAENGKAEDGRRKTEK